MKTVENILQEFDEIYAFEKSPFSKDELEGLNFMEKHMKDFISSAIREALESVVPEEKTELRWKYNQGFNECCQQILNNISKVKL